MREVPRDGREEVVTVDVDRDEGASLNVPTVKRHQVKKRANAVWGKNSHC